MSLPADPRLARTSVAEGTGFARTRYGTTARTTVLAVRGVQSWRRLRRAAAATGRWVGETITTAGWLVIGTAVIGVVVGLVLGIVEAAVAGTAALVLLALSVPFLFSARAYDVDLRVAHDRVIAGTPVEGTLVVTNVGTGPALPGRIDVPVGAGLVDVHVPFLRHAHTHTETVVVPTHRRGIIEVGPVRTVRGDPLGILVREHAWRDIHTLYVHPATTVLRSTLTGFIRDLEGSASRTVVDADFSFHAIRPYVAGDSQRQIHWKSTAKTGALMVRQYEETRRSRMVLTLAVGETEFADDEEFELAVSAAASLGARGIRDGRDVDVVLGGDVPEFARRTVRTVRELTTITTRTLLDDLAGIERAEHVSPLRDAASLAAEGHPDASIAFLVCGSTVTPGELQSAALSFPADVGVVAVRCEPDAEPGVRRLGAVTVLTIGLLGDLRQLLARGASS